ncbi:uncharacterized protein [Arachis hypogaea]|uniref:uncharacterized protein n=1 Tax=Arachis hypogaea TaxID=3818 RepID=UPI003B21C0E0
MAVAGLGAAAPSSQPRPRRVAAVALPTSPPSSSRAWRRHSAAGFVGFPPSNPSLPPLLTTRTKREGAQKRSRCGVAVAAVRLGSPLWRVAAFLHHHRRSITGAAGLTICYCCVAGTVLGFCHSFRFCSVLG